jgi:hypothetical protein
VVPTTEFRLPLAWFRTRFVKGEMGMGKSRLWQECIALACPPAAGLAARGLEATCTCPCAANRIISPLDVWQRF